MAATLPPGIGNDQQAAQATAFMREQPWYRQLFLSWGVNPDNPGDFHLSEDQQKQLLTTARDHGIGISDKYGIDRNGAIHEDGGSLWKKIAIGGAIAGSMFIPGVAPAVMGALGSVGSGLGSVGSAIGHGAGSLFGGLTGASGAASGLSKVTGALGAGSKLASLFDIGKGAVDTYGSQAAATANQLANNRINAAKVDQGGPAADTAAFRNAMRAGLVARMNPGAAPLNINGHVLPSLVTPETQGYAKTMFDTLNTRQAQGKTPTEFGVPDPTQAELDASGRAKTLGTVSGAMDTGSKIASLFGLGKSGKPPLVTATDIPYPTYDETLVPAGDGF